MASTQDVLTNHLRAFDEGDLNGILSDYAPGAVFFTQGGVVKGVDAIRPLFEALIAEFGKPGARFNMKQQSVEAITPTSFGRQRRLSIFTKWRRTRWSCGRARLWPSHSPRRLRRRGRKARNHVSNSGEYVSLGLWRPFFSHEPSLKVMPLIGI